LRLQVAVYKAVQSCQPLDDKSVADSENLGTLLIQSLAIPGTALVVVCRAGQGRVRARESAFAAFACSHAWGNVAWMSPDFVPAHWGVCFGCLLALFSSDWATPFLTSFEFKAVLSDAAATKPFFSIEPLPFSSPF
jgi:hypothetical protein